MLSPVPKAESNFVADLIDRISAVTQGTAALHEPSFGGKERDYLRECIDTGWVSSGGPFVDRFEALLSERTGSPFATAMINGTAALHTCLMLAGVGTGDEVIAPTLTFIATANAIAYTGAVPHLADVAPETLAIDPEKLRAHLSETCAMDGGHCVNRKTGRRIKVLLCVHLLGHPADLDALAALCAEFGLILIEDAAEGLGSTYKGRHVGTFGRLAALSFNGNKIITTGGGGAVLTSDAELAAAARHLTTTAKRSHAWRYEHDRVGYNYRLPNINAALGCAQLEQLDDHLAEKRALAQRYHESFDGLDGATLFMPPNFANSNHWLNALVLDPSTANARNTILDETNACGIGTRPLWAPIHHQTPYISCPSAELSVADDLYARVIALPSSPHLGAGLA
ncbi:MAG: LegC family aminotransferase [Rhodospirillales bacterium]